MATEKRLIDANELQRRICGAKCGCEYEDCGCEGDCQFDFFISNAPTVEAVEVIRCHNCQNSEPCKARGQVWCPKIGRYMKEDGFCSEGVMKDA